MSGAVTSFLYVLAHLILKTPSRDRHDEYYPHFANEETEAKRAT